MFLIKIAHKELLDLQSSSVPPRKAHQKCVRARSSCQSRRFRVEKEPLLWIGGGFCDGARVESSLGQQQRERTHVGRTHLGRCIPSSQRQVLPVAIPPGLSAEKLRETIALRREVRCARRFNIALARRPQRSNVREFVGEVQMGTPQLPQRHRGAEKGFGTTDSHGLRRIRKKDRERDWTECKRDRQDLLCKKEMRPFICLSAVLLSVFISVHPWFQILFCAEAREDCQRRLFCALAALSQWADARRAPVFARACGDQFARL